MEDIRRAVLNEDEYGAWYKELWDKLNGKRDHGAYAWEKNPWVWVIDFERVEDYGQAD
jgi:hypothetical protein